MGNEKYSASAEAMDGRIFVHCQECNTPYPMDLAEAEEMGKEGRDFLCLDCWTRRSAEMMERPRRKFEYMRLICKTVGEMNELGAEGWQLVASSGDVLIFSREVFNA